MDLPTLQARLEERYGEGDAEMGLRFLALVLVEEVGELAEAVRRSDETSGEGESFEAVREESVDVLFMALSIANRVDVDVEAALKAKYLDRPRDEVTATWSDVSWRDDGEDG